MKHIDTDEELDAFDPHQWPFYWATQMVGMYLRELETSLKRNGLDVSRYRVLMSVGDRCLSIGEIADLAIVKMPTMMKIIQRMEGEGLLTSSPRESDGRFTDVQLTRRGKEMRRIAWNSADRVYATSFKGISARDEAKFNSISQLVFEQLRGPSD